MTSKHIASKHSFNKSIKVPSSKSYANRVLILASLCTEPVEVLNLPKSTDVNILINCLKEVGLSISEVEDGIRIENSFPACEKDIQNELTLESGDGGTTNRFLIPFLALGKRKYNVEALGGMRTRPMDELESSLLELGSQVIRNDEHWFSVQGPLKNDATEIEVDCSRSTQFATGLALALWDKKVKLKTKGLDASKQYFELTEDLVKQFESKKRKFIVPVDASSLSYPLALGLMTDGVVVSNCFEKDALQADSVFIDIIKEIGGDISLSENGLCINKSKNLKPMNRDCSRFPDLVPTLAFVCSKIEGTSVLRNLEVLRHKESDRIDEIIKILDLFEVKYKFDEKTQDLHITGTLDTFPNEVSYTPAPDHRMVMVSYLFMRTHSGGKLGNASHVAKSFSNFFEVMN